MYFNSETMRAARLAAVDHYQLAANIFLDSNARLIDLYSDTGGKVLDTVSVETAQRPSLFKSVVPDFFIGHLRVASHIHQDLMRFLEARLHGTGSLMRSTFDNTMPISPPMVELADDDIESMADAGESAAVEPGNVEEVQPPAPATKKKAPA